MRFFAEKELEARHIPRPRNFAEALEGIRSGFNDTYIWQEGVWNGKMAVRLVGAVVIGSVARGTDLRPTSGIDIVVFYEDRGASMLKILQCIDGISKSWVGAIAEGVASDIPINLYNIFSSRLASSKTRHNRQFLGHVMRSVAELPENDGTPPLLCGETGEILSMYEKAPPLRRDNAEMYLWGKLDKLVDASSIFNALPEERRLHALANAVNASFHGARQVLDVCGVPYLDTKQGVINACKEVSFYDVSAQLSLIAGVAHEYDCEIQALLRGSGVRPELPEKTLIQTAVTTLECLAGKIR